MMKNKKLKIFVYLSVILGFLVSCRTDFVNEQIAKKSNASSLTTKRISLQESSHRQRLTPILSELKKNINIDNTFGKSVNFGDSITINTDDIILMENGTNFHTYTFRINRNNSSTNAPIENLLLIPKSDGSYEGYMIVFNLNEQEKQKILNNEKLDLRNKTIITKFENNGIFNLFSKACIPTYINIAVRCGGEEGHMPGLPCPHAGTNLAAYWTYVVVYDCFDTGTDLNANIYPTEPIPGGGGIFSCPDCPAPEPCVQVPTSPTPSTAITDGNGCVVGLPTTPNIGINETPCKKIKNTINKPQIKDTIASYKTFAQVSKKKEKGFMEYTNGTLVSGQVSKDLRVTHVYGFTSVGTIHVHPLEGIAMFSPNDLLNFITLLKYQNPTSIKNAYAGMISSSGNYYINFTGTASDLPPISQQEYIDYLLKLEIKYREIVENLRKSENKPKGTQLSQQGREKLFFEVMKYIGLDGKINLIKEENGTLYNISEGVNGNPPTSTPCN